MLVASTPKNLNYGISANYRVGKLPLYVTLQSYELAIFKQLSSCMVRKTPGERKKKLKGFQKIKKRGKPSNQ